MLVAWLALRDAPPSAELRYADIGCGVGSVLFPVVRALRPVRAVGVEAQAQSVALSRRTVAELPADAPAIEIVHGDLREVEGDGSFDIVTGSPPYFPVGAGVLSPDAQRRACRFELRGGVEAYCDAGARLLAPEGRLHLVFQTRWTDRVERAGRDAGLMMVRRVDVRTRATDADAFLSGYTFVRDTTRDPAACAYESLAVRDSEGRVLAEWHAVRQALGYTDAPAS